MTTVPSSVRFTDGSDTITVVPAALQLLGLNQSPTAGAPDDPFQVGVELPNAGNTALQQVQQVRVGGGSLTATVTNSNAAAGQLAVTGTTAQTVTEGCKTGRKYNANRTVKLANIRLRLR